VEGVAVEELGRAGFVLEVVEEWSRVEEGDGSDAEHLLRVQETFSVSLAANAIQRFEAERFG
jgi:hypothetical protein